MAACLITCNNLVLWKWITLSMATLHVFQWCSLCVCVSEDAPCDNQDPVWLHKQHQCSYSIILAQNKQSDICVCTWHATMWASPHLPSLGMSIFHSLPVHNMGRQATTIFCYTSSTMDDTITYEFQQIDNLLLWEAQLLSSCPVWMDSAPHMKSWICIVTLYILATH